MLSKVLLFSWIAVLPAVAATCESLASLTLPNTKITAAETISSGTFTSPEGAPVRNLPSLCRVAGTIQPVADSVIPFEVWMPSSGWNGKFQGVGNGGYAGSTGYAALGANVALGYASAGTDTGHRGGATDANWALGHPQKVIDFGHRAIHETTEKAKAIIAAFYGNGPKKSYFASCSNGGRQALMEAERYPADYDGIIAGAPAAWWTHLLTTAVWDAQSLFKDPGSFIPPAKIPAIESAVLAACDATDGLKDGLIDDPTRCKFDPSVLLCKDADAESCLTAPQVAALKKIYSGPLNAKGKQVYEGRPVSGEAGNGGWIGWITGGAPEKSLGFAFGTQFFKNMVYGNADWDYRTFSVDRDMQAADEKLASVLNANDPDLKRFYDRGGKLILYHGWSDAAIPATATIDYYRSVESKMGSKKAGSFVRLFMVPGMQHCGGGPGPNEFGGALAAQGDAQHDLSKALEVWVEDGVAPDQIIAVRRPAPASNAAARTRPLCPYPLVARWKGSGSMEDAANFSCVKP